MPHLAVAEPRSCCCHSPACPEAGTLLGTFSPQHQHGARAQIHLGGFLDCIGSSWGRDREVLELAGEAKSRAGRLDWAVLGLLQLLWHCQAQAVLGHIYLCSSHTAPGCCTWKSLKMLSFFIHFQSNTRVLPSSRRGAEIAAPLWAHMVQLTSHSGFYNGHFCDVPEAQPGSAQPCQPAGECYLAFFSSATMEGLCPESQHFSVGRAASNSLVSLTHTCVSSARWGEARIFQVRSCPLSCLPPERLKAQKWCSKEVDFNWSRWNILDTARFFGCWENCHYFPPKVSSPGRAAKNSRIMGFFSRFLSFSSFLFSALTLDLKPFPHPLNQMLEQDKPDEHNVPRGALGVFFHFCRTRTLQIELASRREAGAQWARWKLVVPRCPRVR